MTNLARNTYKVEHHGSFVIVWTPWGPITCMNQQHLWNLICKDELPMTVNCKNVKATKETVEEYLARGGKINKVGFPQPKKLTLEDLGLINKAFAPDPEEEQADCPLDES